MRSLLTRHWHTFWAYSAPRAAYSSSDNKDAPLDRFQAEIPIPELKFVYSRSSGPGGQNVNKVNSKVELRFHVDSAHWMDPGTKDKFISKFGSSLTKDGFYVVTSQKTRLQGKNQQDAVAKLRRDINLSLEPEQPKFTPDEIEAIQRGKVRFERKIMEQKRIRSRTKQDRRNSDW